MKVKLGVIISQKIELNMKVKLEVIIAQKNWTEYESKTGSNNCPKKLNWILK
jgi:hypothetical protein